MSKEANLKADLVELLGAFFATGESNQLLGYLLANSNLPGPRANLELSRAFGDAIAGRAGEERERAWSLCQELSGISADEAPVNSPREFLPFYAAVGLGAIGSISPQHFEGAFAGLRTLAHDPRWRMREAVRMGLQRMLARRGQDTLRVLEAWMADTSLLEKRAVAATLVDPSLLKDEEAARAAYGMHRDILDRVLQTQDRKSEEFKVLRKALGYTLSLVVCALPQDGFELMATRMRPRRSRSTIRVSCEPSSGE